VIFLDIPQDRAEWLALRERHIGASEVAALYDLQPDYAPGRYALWMHKAGRVPLPEVTGDLVEWGLRNEPAIAAGAAAMGGWTLQPGFYASHECGLGATLDRVAAAPGEVELEMGWTGMGCIELKNVGYLQAVQGRAWGGDDPPPHVRLQLQAQMAASGFRWGAIAALIGGNSLRIWRYAAAPELQAEMIRAVAAFWQSIRDGVPPVPDGSDLTTRAIRVQLPEREEEPMDLRGDNQAEEAAATYHRLRAEKKRIEAEMAEAKNILLEKAGAHRAALLNGFNLSFAHTAAKSARPAEPGEMIPGRAASVRIIVKEHVA
jgi:predicted phage-related endonuclease